jgi:hypothetical protein
MLRGKPEINTINRGQLPADRCPPSPGDRLERLSGRTITCRNTRSHIMSPPRSQPGSSTEVSLGGRGHAPTPQRAHPPPIPTGFHGIHAGGRHPRARNPIPQKPPHDTKPLDIPPAGQVSGQSRIGLALAVSTRTGANGAERAQKVRMSSVWRNEFLSLRARSPLRGSVLRKN